MDSLTVAGVTPERLEDIARIVAAQSQGLDFDEVRQQTRIKFWRYPPRYEGHAWRMAWNVRNDIWRRQKKHRRPIRGPTSYTIDGQIEARWALRRLWEAAPDKVMWLLNYAERRPHPKKDVVRACRYRKALRRVVG